MASSRDTPVMRSAARLKAVIRHLGSTVKTPSLIESRIVISRWNALLAFMRVPLLLRKTAPPTIVHYTTHWPEIFILFARSWRPALGAIPQASLRMTVAALKAGWHATCDTVSA